MLSVVVDQIQDHTSFHPNVDPIRHLWKDSGIQKAYERRREYQLSDSTYYYLSDLDRISRADYIPTQQDILRVRNVFFISQFLSYNIRPLRVYKYILFLLLTPQKCADYWNFGISFWSRINCFPYGGCWWAAVWEAKMDPLLRKCYVHHVSCCPLRIWPNFSWRYRLSQNLTGVLFLFLENNQNRMEESKALFQHIVEYPYFQQSSVILFLNKKDLLEEKIKTSHLKEYFPQYKGPEQDPQMARNRLFNTKNTFLHIVVFDISYIHFW